jgi:beta-glucuronidase
MRRVSVQATLAVLVLLLAGPIAAAPAQEPYAAETPAAKALYQYGNKGRFLLDGKWLFRMDSRDQGIGKKFFRQRSTAGWSQVDVPYDWTAGRTDDPSDAGDVAWYRKDFKVPGKRTDLTWLVRFESVNYRATIYLNGRFLAEHTGGYLPFEIPLSRLKRGVNRLVVRTDSRRLESDIPTGGFDSTGRPRGGWWNPGGMNREVYLRRVRDVDMALVRVMPKLVKVGGRARVRFEVTLRNYSDSAQTVRLKGRFGKLAVKFRGTRVPPGQFRVAVKTITVKDPSLWSPPEPNLYRVSVSGTANGNRIEGYALRSGIRKIEVTPDGRLELNGKRVNAQGFGMHEDNIVTGTAVTNAIRDRYIAWTRDLGATILRSHTPWSPYLEEQADRQGVLLWSEIPVWSVPTAQMSRAVVREFGLEQLRQNILANGNHASIITWSVANELPSRPGGAEARWYAESARTAKELDPTRPVSAALIGYPTGECFAAYAPFDMLGLNTYFGWYPAPVGQTADRMLLSGYLDAMRACYPRKAQMITEYGAEGNRNGPPEEKGTYQFQDEYTRFTLDMFKTKPWLAGAVYWTLQEFRVRPGYTGNNPRGEPPWHQNGPLDRFGNKRPIYGVLQSYYRSTPQYVDEGGT